MIRINLESTLYSTAVLENFAKRVIYKKFCHWNSDIDSAIVIWRIFKIDLKRG